MRIASLPRNPLVAIIGVLAAVALPSYQNYVKRSKKLEAHTALSAIYVAQQAYFAENSRYNTLDSIGGFEFGKLNSYKFIGFTSKPTTGTWGSALSLSAGGGTPSATAVGTDCVLAKDSFKAGAFDAATAAGVVLESQQIDEKKNITPITGITCA